ncbi:unnamed protein product [Ambrosiozyma monospora]|uniref:Unnamed protein product n=1 Tax=Ambrosiozyma monospora TaxID=43982 RepID=A0A9W7DCM9_AMBMO|nr:unnamed protein product [Ambrosiozyma monospora]
MLRLSNSSAIRGQLFSQNSRLFLLSQSKRSIGSTQIIPTTSFRQQLQQQQRSLLLLPPTSPPSSNLPNPVVTVVPSSKPTLKQKIKKEVEHYWNGTKLLGYEIKVSSKLLIKMLAGYELTRRENTQLQTTISDILRLIPFSMFVLVPFAELLLPIALKLFPNLLPSTYESATDKDKKKQLLASTRKKASEFIQQTFNESGLTMPKKINEENKELFINFYKTINQGLKPSHEELIKIARCFKNDQVLDNLSRPQLMAMAKYMSLTPYGTDELLRYQIRYRLLQIIKDDKAIDYEGVDSLTIPELQTACASRGIRSATASPARLREDLNTWLDLRLRQKIPSSLLILSSTFTYGEHADDLESYYDALLGVLSSIPDELYNVAKLDLFQHDDKLKLNILKEQDELIKEESVQNQGVVKNVRDNLKLNDYEEEDHHVEEDGKKAEGTVDAKKVASTESKTSTTTTTTTTKAETETQQPKKN